MTDWLADSVDLMHCQILYMPDDKGLTHRNTESSFFFLKIMKLMYIAKYVEALK